MYSETEKMVEGIAEQMGIGEAEQSIFNKFMSTVMSEMKDRMSWEKMKEPLIDVYVKHYTQKEIDEILAFYKTETGQSLIKKMPLVMSDSMQVSQSMFKEFLPRIMELAKQMGEEVEASRKAGEETEASKKAGQ
jgi:uncharacterized protein